MDQGHEQAEQLNPTTQESDSFLQKIKDVAGGVKEMKNKGGLVTALAMIPAKFGFFLEAGHNMEAAAHDINNGQFAQGSVRLVVAAAEGLATFALHRESNNLARGVVKENKAEPTKR